MTVSVSRTVRILNTVGLSPYIVSSGVFKRVYMKPNVSDLSFRCCRHPFIYHDFSLLLLIKRKKFRSLNEDAPMQKNKAAYSNDDAQSAYELLAVTSPNFYTT